MTDMRYLQEAQANRDFVMVKGDLTKDEPPLHDQSLSRYRVKEVPTLVFLGGQGKEREDLRPVDFLPPEEFLSRRA